MLSNLVDLMIFQVFFGQTLILIIHSEIILPLHTRAVGRSENSGVPVLFRRHNLPPLVEIGLTDRPKIGGAMASPAPPGTTGLLIVNKIII